MLLIQFTGLSGSGKTTISTMAQKELARIGLNIEVLDGDDYRKTLCKGLGFSYEDRVENLRRLGIVGKLLLKHNIISVISAINPFESIRQELAAYSPKVKTVWVRCGMETLIKRDTKGLYKKALLPDGNPDKVYQFTGVSDLYEIPKNPDLILDTDKETPDESVKKLTDFILSSINNPSDIQ